MQTENSALTEMAQRIEAEPLYDAALTRLAFDLVEGALPEVDKAMVRKGAVGSADAVLLLIDHAFPGWAIAMHGTASEKHGNWTCTLRRSDLHDSDAYVGVGRGPKLSNALIGALLKALAHRTAG